jgi:hypothetical protein
MPTMRSANDPWRQKPLDAAGHWNLPQAHGLIIGQSQGKLWKPITKVLGGSPAPGLLLEPRTNNATADLCVIMACPP